MIELTRAPTKMSSKVNHTTHTHTTHTITKKKPTKSTHVPTACINCKRAHLACDLSRPCKRCTTLDKEDTCIDIQHKQRGRPKLTAAKKWQNFSTSTTNTLITAPQSTSSGNFPSLLPMAAPGLAACTFNLTLNNNSKNKKIKPLPPSTSNVSPKNDMMTIFLSMDLCCARVSDESVDFLNTHPSNLDCSFYDLIHSDSSETLSRIHRLLLENSHSNRVPQQPISFTTTASSDLFLTSPPAQLFQIANGSQTIRETLKFKSSGKDLSCRFYLGGGFGADLFIPSTLDNLYMVCIVSDLNATTTATNIAKGVGCQQTIMQRKGPESTEPLLFSPEQQQQLDAILNTPDLMSMYNANGSAATEQDTMELVNHLCQVIMAPSSVSSPFPTLPATPPSDDYTDSKAGYRSDSSFSSSSTSSRSLGHFLDQEAERFLVSQDSKKSDDLSAILDDNSLFMLNASPKALLDSTDCWEYHFAC